MTSPQIHITAQLATSRCRLLCDSCEDAPAHPEDGASAEEREDEEALRGEIIDDVLLNNMERQWTGRDFFMEHIDGIAARNLGTSQESDSLNQSYRHTRYESF